MKTLSKFQMDYIRTLVERDLGRNASSIAYSGEASTSDGYKETLKSIKSAIDILEILDGHNVDRILEDWNHPDRAGDREPFFDKPASIEAELQKEITTALDSLTLSDFDFTPRARRSIRTPYKPESEGPDGEQYDTLKT